MELTVGSVLINNALPEDLRDYGRVMDAKGVSSLLAEVAARYPERYREISHRLLKLGERAAWETGGYSISLEHLRKSPTARRMQAEAQKEINRVLGDKSLTATERRRRIVAAVTKMQPTYYNEVFQEALQEKNPIAMQALSGARGSSHSLAGLIAGDLLYADPKSDPVPIPVFRSYAEGLTPAEHLASAYGARRGIIVTKLATRDAGALGKQLNQLMHRLVVVDTDDPDEPATVRGLPVDVDDSDSEGSLLAVPVGDYPRNTVLTPKILRAIKRLGHKRILIRSPITSYATGGGLYGNDVGVRESYQTPGRGQIAPRGFMAGNVSAQSLSEPISQGSLGAKHGGGVAGQDKAVTGFAYLNSLLQVPKTFPGGATHTEEDGAVRKIRPAPAGGLYVTVGDVDYHVAEGKRPVVSIGQKVEAGDVLSTGIPNPAMIVKHKHLGEGQRYFATAFRDAMRESGLSASRRDTELLARGLINHVRLTGEYGDGVPEDVIPYSSIARGWQPRESSTRLPAGRATGRYLEEPVLHYTVGTKIRPSVVKTLADFGVENVLTHVDPPPFEPEMVRAAANLQFDEDWMTRMYGSNLKKTFEQGVHRGDISDESGTSFVPSLAKSVSFGTEGLFSRPTSREKMGVLFDGKGVPGSSTAGSGSAGRAQVAASPVTATAPVATVAPAAPDPSAYWKSPQLPQSLRSHVEIGTPEIESGYLPRLPQSVPQDAASEYQRYQQQWNQWRKTRSDLENLWASQGEAGRSAYRNAWRQSPTRLLATQTPGSRIQAGTREFGGFEDVSPVAESTVRAAVAGAATPEVLSQLLQDPGFSRQVRAALRESGGDKQSLRAALPAMAQNYFGPRVGIYDQMRKSYTSFGGEKGLAVTDIPGLQTYVDLAARGGGRIWEPEFQNRYLAARGSPLLAARTAGAQRAGAVARSEMGKSREVDNSTLAGLVGATTRQFDPADAQLEYEGMGKSPAEAARRAAEDRLNLRPENDPTIGTVAKTVGHGGLEGVNTVGRLLRAPMALASMDSQKIQGAAADFAKPFRRLVNMYRGGGLDSTTPSYEDQIWQSGQDRYNAYAAPQTAEAMLQQKQQLMSEATPQRLAALRDAAASGDAAALAELQATAAAFGEQSSGRTAWQQQMSDSAATAGPVARAINRLRGTAEQSIPTVLDFGGAGAATKIPIVSKLLKGFGASELPWGLGLESLTQSGEAAGILPSESSPSRTPTAPASVSVAQPVLSTATLPPIATTGPAAFSASDNAPPPGMALDGSTTSPLTQSQDAAASGGGFQSSNARSGANMSRQKLLAILSLLQMFSQGRGGQGGGGIGGLAALLSILTNPNLERLLSGRPRESGLETPASPV